MTVGLVLVSHVADIAEGVRRLAAQMAPDVTIAVAGGDDEAGIGTSFDKVLAALETAIGAADGGVAVLYDLGSALLTAETAVEMLGDEHVAIVDAPLVEGALAAATAAQQGDDLDAVVQAASAQGPAGAQRAMGQLDENTPGGDARQHTVTLPNPLGLHARPAADLARLLGGVDARVLVAGTEGPWVDARSVVAVIGLGLRGGDEVRIAAEGVAADSALERIVDLVEAGFGETGSDGGPQTLDGVAASPGVGEGRAVLAQVASTESRDDARERSDDEEGRLRTALEVARAQLGDVDEAYRTIAAAHRTLLDDPMLAGRAVTLVHEGAVAEGAWAQAVTEAYGVLAGVTDPDMAARAADVLDVGGRVSAALGDREYDAGLPDTHALAGSVVVADEVLPSQVVRAHAAGAVGVVGGRGGQTAHAAQLARVLDLPAVLGAGDAVRRIGAGQRVRVDGARGRVEVR